MNLTPTPLTILLVAALALVPLGLGAAPSSGSQTVSPAGAQPSEPGPAEFFTGRVRVDPLFDANAAASFTGGYVTFEPSARSAWHTHPAGQRLIVTAGAGLTQEWDGPVVEVRAGDVIWCPPGVKHWHGAAPTTAMTHLALTGEVDGENVTWMEKVTDAQYQGE